MEVMEGKDAISRKLLKGKVVNSVPGKPGIATDICVQTERAAAWPETNRAVETWRAPPRSQRLFHQSIFLD